LSQADRGRDDPGWRKSKIEVKGKKDKRRGKGITATVV